MAETRAAAYLSRLDAAHERLSVLAGTPRAGLTAADPATGERWEEGQVWAHLAEFVPYWSGQLGLVCRDGLGAAVPFGRTAADPGRIAAIARDHHADRTGLHIRVEAGLAALRAQLARMTPAEWDAQGVHPTLGAMGVDRFLEEFLVGHVEQHARQLDEI